MVAFLQWLGLLVWAGALGAQQACPRPTLPAYSHNDYQWHRPLSEAVELGYRGVEADVFLVAESLRVGHDRREASRGPTLATAYLRPLAGLLDRCQAPDSAGAPFLLFIEMKEETPLTRRELARLLGEYAPSLGLASTAARLRVVLVGRQRGAPHAEFATFASQEFGVDSYSARPVSTVALLSLNYGETMGNRYVRRAERDRWMAAIRELRREFPGTLIRAHNVPLSARVYRELFEAGVDLIGTEDLRATRELLGTIR